jgi:hypothetical protein
MLIGVVMETATAIYTTKFLLVSYLTSTECLVLLVLVLGDFIDCALVINLSFPQRNALLLDMLHVQQPFILIPENLIFLFISKIDCTVLWMLTYVLVFLGLLLLPPLKQYAHVDSSELRM